MPKPPLPMSAAANLTPQDVERLNGRFKNAPSLKIIRWAADTFRPKVALTSSFGAKSAALIHMAISVDPRIEIRVVDTGLLFPETYEFLLPRSGVALDPRAAEARAFCSHADLAVVVDTCEAPRIARVNPLIAGLPKVILDHHPPGESPLQGVALLDPEACASGELVYDALLAAGG
ncbi:MAG: phosphoadenosine phosphosulfate reductase family protein, partial [Candidatus Omnitrophica bacterium]|nr:phosphoadenosine phosphosulfate reductase family protein [Candidatus Omnitrophota bacterium]